MRVMPRRLPALWMRHKDGRTQPADRRHSDLGKLLLQGISPVSNRNLGLFGDVQVYPALIVGIFVSAQEALLRHAINIPKRSGLRTPRSDAGARHRNLTAGNMRHEQIQQHVPCRIREQISVGYYAPVGTQFEVTPDDLCTSFPSV